MYCEKCGSPLSDDAKFCESCGEPADGASAAAAAENGGEREQPVNPWMLPSYVPESAKPPAPRLSPRRKKLILRCSVACGILLTALLLLFAVVLPAVGRAREEGSKADISRYYTVSFKLTGRDADKPGVARDRISGEFVWDYEKFAEEQSLGAEDARRLLTDISPTLTIRHSYTGTDKTSARSFSGLKEGDTVFVSFGWPQESGGAVGMGSMDYVDRYEQDYGVRFKHEDTVREYRLSDELKERGISVEKPIEADILGYIKSNSLIAEESSGGGTVTVFFKPFETSAEGYTFKLEERSLSVDVYNKDNTKTGSFDLHLGNRFSLRQGDSVTADYVPDGRKKMETLGIILTGEPVVYTVSDDNG